MGRVEKIIHNVRFYDHTPKAIHCIVYDDSTKSLALSRSDGTIEIWDGKEKIFRRHLIQVPDGVTSDALIWDNNRLFSGDFDGFIVEYDLVSQQPKSKASVTGGSVWCVALSPDKTKIAAGTEEGYICIFDIVNELQYVEMIHKLESRVMSVAWHSNGKYLVAGSIDYVSLWSTDKVKVSRFPVGRETKSKETIIWSIALLDDMTVVTADSRGMCSFWNGNLGTLIDEIQTHKADILTLQVSANQQTVTCAGVDPVIVQIEKVTTHAKHGRNRMWVKTIHRHIHTHDVRALALTAQNRLFSGGVDTDLVQSYFPPKTAIKYPALPNPGFISIAKEAGCILLNCNDHVELWRLGKSEESISGTNGSFMNISENRVKLLDLYCKKSDRIKCCAVSPSASHLCYITSGNISVYKYTLPKDGNPATTKKLKNMSKEIEKSKHVLWLNDNLAASLTFTDTIQILKIEDEEIIVSSQIDTVKNERVHLLSASDDGCYLGVAHKSGVTVFYLRNVGTFTHLPRKECLATAIKIKDQTIVAAYSDLEIIEFDLKKRSFTPFCRQIMNNFPIDWIKRNYVVQHITIDSTNTNNIFLHDVCSVILLDKNNSHHNTSPEKNAKKVSKNEEYSNANQQKKVFKGAFTMIDRPNLLLFFDEIRQNEVVSVEINSMELEDKLPPPLKIKKFGAA